MAANLPPPFIYLPNVANLRDAGGLTVADSNAVVKSKILYRSADPTLATDDEIKTLREELGIQTIFDLRSLPEHVSQGEDVVAAFDARLAAYSSSKAPGEGIQRLWTPVFANEDYSPEKIATRFRNYASGDDLGFVRAYTQILEHAGPCYGKVLRHLAKQNSGAVLLHCTAGKDRTGVLVALLLTLLGVPKAEVAQEYHLTETGLAHRREHTLERLLATGLFEGEDGRQAALRMSGARAESMEKTIDLINERWGSAEDYIKSECRLSAEEIQALKKNLVSASGASKRSSAGATAVL